MSEHTVEQEIVDHVINPKNYGELHDADGVGVGVDNATKAYVILYLNINNEIISDSMFATSGSQDAVALGSMLTEMIKGDAVGNATKWVSELEAEVDKLYIQNGPPKIDLTKPEGEQVESISTEQQDSASMVLTAFRAAIEHIERKKRGIVEEQYSMNIKKKCPYSNTDCEHA